MRRVRKSVFSASPTLILLCVSLSFAPILEAQVKVRHREGLIHGFLLLSTLDGEILADGEQTQTARGEQVTSHLVFHFKDGSLHEETTVFSQRTTLRLISAHLVQKGPTFKHPTDFSVNAASGEVTVRHTDSDGNEKTFSDRLKLPIDVANGMILTSLKNIPPKTSHVTLSVVAATPKPRVVKLEISPVGEDSFAVGSFRTRKAIHYVVKINIGGVVGLLAPLAGKQPPETHVWILDDPAPAFFRSEGALYQGGPIWRIALTSPR